MTEAKKLDISEIPCTGIREIDEQHAQLVDLYNRLVDWTERGHELAAIFDAMTALEAYIDKHFAFEEALLARIDYPSIGEHRLRHANWPTNLRTMPKPS